MEIIKEAYRSSIGKNIECPVTNCTGIVEVKKELAGKNPYKKRGDYALMYKCDKCSRSDVTHHKGTFRV